MEQCDLAKRSCIPCRGGIPPLRGADLSTFVKQLKGGWKIIEERFLQKEYLFDDFKKALAFTNKVGEVAELEGHHPDIHLSYGKVKIILWTHKIDGLSESDFILAAKCDEL